MGSQRFGSDICHNRWSMSKSAKRWWCAIGLGAGLSCVIALISSSALQAPSIFALVSLGGLLFTLSVYGLGWFKAPFPIGVIPRSVVILLVTWGGMIFLGYRVYLEQQPSMVATGPTETCKITATANSDIVERLYFRGDTPPQVDTTLSYRPSSREWFYEWQLLIRPNTDIPRFIVSIDKIEDGEVPKIIPKSPTASFRREPNWNSGFPEKGKPPDSWSGIIDIGFVSRNTDYQLLIRRPIRLVANVRNAFPDSYTLRDFSITVPMPCDTDKHNYDFHVQTEIVLRKLFALVSYGLNGPVSKSNPPIPIRDPNIPTPPLKKNEFEYFMELRCSNDLCSGTPKFEQGVGHSGETWNTFESAASPHLEPRSVVLEQPTIRGFHEKEPDQITFKLGGLAAGYHLSLLGKQHMQPFYLNGYVPITVYSNGNALLFDFKMWNGPNGPSVEVINNSFTATVPRGWDKNSSANALEVVDDEGRPMFQMIRQTSTEVVINGVFPLPDGQVLIAGPSSGRITAPSNGVKLALSPFFKYPSWKYPGQFAEASK